MANRRKGEVELEAGDEVFSLRFSTNAICSLEDELGMGINHLGSVMADPSQFRLATLRSVVRACLTEPVSLEKAGDIIDAAGMAKVAEQIGKAFQAAFPDASKSAEGNDKAAAGTGTKS